jgi:Tfp pilus assembly protein PilX
MLRRRRPEAGQALIGALAFLSFFGLVSLAAFNFIDSSVRQHQRTETTAANDSLAEGATQYAVNTIANAKGTNCDGPASGTASWTTQGVTDTFSYKVNSCIPAYQNSPIGANCVLCLLGTASDALKFTNGNSMVNVRGEIVVNGGIALQGSWQKDNQGQYSWNGSTLCSATQASPSSCFPGGAGVAEFIGVGDYADTTNGVYPTPSPMAPGATQPYTPAPTAINTITDPLSALSPPSFASAPYSSAGPVTMSGGTTVLTPGAYQGVSISGGQTLKLQAGTYVFTGDIKTSGTGILDGSAGVTIYLACFNSVPHSTMQQPRLCNAGEAGAALNVQGGGTYNITAPSSGTYQNIGVFEDRRSTSQLSIGGSGTSNVVSGGLYAASANVDIGGNGNQIFQNNGRLVARTVTIHVNASAGLDLIGTVPVTSVCDLYNASVTGTEGGNSRSGQVIFVADPGGVCGGTRIASFSYTS